MNTTFTRRDALNWCLTCGVTATTSIYPDIAKAQGPSGPGISRRARGLKIPPGFETLVRYRIQSAEAADAVIKGNESLAKHLTLANPNMYAPTVTLPRKFDWRDYDKVTPAKRQDSCNGCWAFAAVGAFESSYLIVNSLQSDWKSFPSIDVSEQDAIDCSSALVDCVVGGFHEYVFTQLLIDGLAGRNPYAYIGQKGLCSARVERPYKIINLGYVQGAGGPTMYSIPHEDTIKEAVLRRGPVVTSVWANDWEKYVKDRSNKLPYRNAVFPGEPTDGLQRKRVQPDHEVLIVGWDNTIEGGVWHVKNSWGPEWGDAGFIKIPYNHNLIGFGASWCVAQPTTGGIEQAISQSNLKNAIFAIHVTEKINNVLWLESLPIGMR